MAAGLVAALLATCLVAVGGTATSAPVSAAVGGCGAAVTPTDPNGRPLIEPYDQADDPLLIPSWSDAGGWTQPSVYETILSGDVDGDGWGDLLGRNGVAIETFTPAPPARRGDMAPYATANPETHPAYPGQWVAKAAVTPTSTSPGPHDGPPAFDDGSTNAVLATATDSPGAVPGFGDPSRFSTLRLADLDGDGDDELLVRLPVFGPPPAQGSKPPYDNATFAPLPVFTGTYVHVYEFVTATDTSGATRGDWRLVTPNGSRLPEWDDVRHHNTTSFGNQSQQPNQTSGVGGPFSLPQYYESIMTGDVDGQPGEELIARGPAGLETYRWDGSTKQFTGPLEASSTNRKWPDKVDTGSTSVDIADGPWYWDTLRIGDFRGDGTRTVVRRDANGLHHAAASPTDGFDISWENQLQSLFGDGQFGKGGQFDPWRTLQVANLDTVPGDELVGIDKQGKLVAAGLDQNGQFMNRVVISGFDFGFDPAVSSSGSYAHTLTVGDVTGGAQDELLIRGPDGMHVYEFDPSGGGTLREIPTQPGVFADVDADGVGTGWTEPSRYETIQTAAWSTSPSAKRVLIGRDGTGIRTYRLEQVVPGGPSTWTSPTTGFPEYAGGADPNAWDEDSDPGKAYRYINDQVAFAMNWGTPTYPGQPVPPLPTIRSKFATGAGVTDWGQVATLVELQEPPRHAISPTLDRADFEAVKRNLADWTRDVQTLWGFFFQSASGQSLEALILSALVIGDQAYPVDQIETQFDPPHKSRLWAIIGDLLWGALGAISPELVAGVDAGAVLKRAGVQAFTSLVGSGISAGISGAGATADQNASTKIGELNVEAGQLDQLLADATCNSIAFLYGSADQAALDLGLLTAMAQSIRALPPPGISYAQVIELLANQRAVWAYQQFASMTASGKGSVGWQLGVGDMVDLPTDQMSSILRSDDFPPTAPTGSCGKVVCRAPYYWQSFIGGPTAGSNHPERVAHLYSPIGKKCDTTSDGIDRPKNAMLTLTQDLGVDPDDMASPTRTNWSKQKGYWDEGKQEWSGSPGDVYVGEPQARRLDPDGDDDTPKFGLYGWRLPIEKNCGIDALLEVPGS